MRRLEGRRIAVTRSEEQAEPLCARLEAEGAVPLRCPTIRILPPESYEGLDGALRKLGTYGWIVFTSSNGVRAVFERMRTLDVPVSRLGEGRVAAVGPRTARALLERGVRADLVPEEGGWVALSMRIEPIRGQRVLLARGDRADAGAGSVLRGRGAAAVDAVVAYRTVPSPPPAQAVRELSAGVDGVTFTSPSTVHGFAQLGPRWREVVGDAVVATIGPSTTAAARRAGLEVNAEAEEPTMVGLVAALAEGFALRAGEPATRRQEDG